MREHSLPLPTIPIVDIGALFDECEDRGARAARTRVDDAILAAAEGPGFMVLDGLPASMPIGAEGRGDLARLFSLGESDLRPLYRQSAAPENPNVYRGFFPLADGIIKRGLDIGPESPSGLERDAPSRTDALLEATPLPPESALPGWRAAMRARFDAFEDLGAGLMRALARALDLPESQFDDAFHDGNSTLRLIEYPPWPTLAAERGFPVRPAEPTDAARGAPRRYAIGGEHVDSGFVTLLEQDDVGGLQARLATPEGDRWVDVPPRERTLAVNFGRLLERWTGGRVRATEHRVLGNDRTRRSIPFFYEPRVDAKIEPLPLPGAERFEPFVYGDHLWEAMTKFSEFARAERWRSAHR